MQDFFVIVETSWKAEAFSQTRPKGPGVLLGLVDLEEREKWILGGNVRPNSFFLDQN